MKRKQLFLIALLALVMSVSLFAAGNSEKVQSGELDRSKYFITVATGPTSGLYYPPIGGAFSSVFQNKLGYKSSAQATGASAENVTLIRENRAEMAIAMSDVVAQAYQALEPMKARNLQLSFALCLGSTLTMYSWSQLKRPVSRSSAT